MTHHHAATDKDTANTRDMEGAAVQIAAGLLVGAGIIVALLLPLPIAAAQLDPQLGATVGCAVSVLV